MIVAAKKQKLWDAMKTGQRVVIDIHYQDQMNGVVGDLCANSLLGAVQRRAAARTVPQGKQGRIDSSFHPCVWSGCPPSPRITHRRRIRFPPSSP